MTLLPGRSRIRIRTVVPAPGVRAKGQDTRVYVVAEDGTETFIPDLVSAEWRVDSRTSYAEAVLVARGVEVEVEGVAADALTAAKAEAESWKRKFEESEREMERREKAHLAREEVPWC